MISQSKLINERQGECVTGNPTACDAHILLSPDLKQKRLRGGGEYVKRPANF